MKGNHSKAENSPDKSFWNTRWENNELGWDIGYASPAIVKYMAQYRNKQAAILIPGCGNAYEAEYLLAEGFTDISLIDIAPKAVKLIKEKFAGKPEVKVYCEDFFEHKGHYDLMIEQTFFCAIPPRRRVEYVQKAASLLGQNGQIIGVLFDRDNEQGPPFGGSSSAYKSIFEPLFELHTLETCYNSIPSRAESEVFINFSKK